MNAYRLTDFSTGHGPWNSTELIATPPVRTFVNGLLSATVGATHSPHTTGGDFHIGERNIVEGSLTVFIEGAAAARTGDPIACGDTCGPGSQDTFIGDAGGGAGDDLIL